MQWSKLPTRPASNANLTAVWVYKLLKGIQSHVIQNDNAEFIPTLRSK
jgi:hypothetical protein